ncbi:hypothetical protein [Rhizobium sp. CSW-27]|uniref:hypothetical protein n=1 Tax=Rhizobium sp. CSW-27 TaxID=2839985 RepID=UPI001C0183A3|nr:hypothetical protein [Rhizobium sp. CSW-27]MBT9370264.1 hypothetical protein [Rhizobium sp. CSW-27]
MMFAQPWQLSLRLDSSLGMGGDQDGSAYTPVINVQSGSGYAGSVYAASLAGGQWHADGVAIAGATGQTWAMLSRYEGQAITYRKGRKTSAPIEMWVPTDTVQTIPMWVDFSRSDLVTLNGSAISAVAGVGGRMSFAQTVGARQPALLAGGLGGLACANPDGSDDCLVGNLASAIVTPCSIWTALDAYISGRGDANIYRQGVSSGAVGYRVSGGPNWAIYGGSGGFNSTDAYTAGPAIRMDYYNGPSSAIGRAGIIYSGGAAGTGVAAGNDFGLFSNGANGAMNAALRCGEILAVSGALSTAARQRLEGYLHLKWGMAAQLAADHPYRTPQSMRLQ